MHDMVYASTNQVPNLVDYNLYTTDIVLQAAMRWAHAKTYQTSLSSYGATLGTSANFTLAHQVNHYAPELANYDRQGRRSDSIVFYPGWQQFLAMGFGQGLHCSAWSQPGVGAHVARAAAFLMHGQIEAGSLCPLTMTAAAIPLLRGESWFDQIASRLFSRDYDARDIPVALKRSMMVGMGMTEKQGGSDLRSNLTQAEPVGAAGRGRDYLLRGHKWFFSSPTSDAHLVLASHNNQFSCFYVPRWLDETHKNNVYIQRIKDKLGNRSNASVEVEFHDAVGILVGEEGKGIANLARMASLTRLDCVLGSTALLRQAVVQAIHHCHYRHAFGRLLIDHELMQNVLMDLALESEAAMVLAIRIAQAFDEPDTPLTLAFRRILTPAAKFWIAKRSIEAIAECMEVWGGNGYIEDGPMARLYREAPVNSIWEGSGNIMCLDVLRGLERHPDQAQALVDYLVQESRADAVLQARVIDLQTVLNRSASPSPGIARYVAQEIVLLTQAVLLLHYAPAYVASAFIASRFASESGRVYGVSKQVTSAQAIVLRAWPYGSSYPIPRD
ncbi:acyl-CoA dehydrogenase family protein [Alcaligenaceae bacterium]|nr:acyl-CoA dehydrogenase family protein [Alcaligenaceae bacterium]